MSTDYRPIPDIQFAQLFDGRLEKYGIKEEVVAKPRDGERYLVGCDGFLQIHQQEDGNCTFRLRRFVPWAVFDALTEEFEVELVSEHDHRYWGFDSQSEWDAFHEKLAKENEDAFYNDLLHFVRGEPNDIRPGTIGMIQAEIGKTLVGSNRGLMAPEKRNALLEAVKAIYDRDHTVSVTQTEKDLASVKMMVTRTDDLPQA